MRKVYTWNTKKVDGGFEYKAGYFDAHAPKDGVTVLQTGILKTRARAAAKAKKWKMYLQSVAA